MMVPSVGKIKKGLIGLAIVLGTTIFCILSGYLALLKLTGPQTDNELIIQMFDRKLRRSADFEIISRAGEASPADPRVLRFRVAFKAYSGPMVCEGEIKYIRGDPSYFGINWDTRECEAQYEFSLGAQSQLK